MTPEEKNGKLVNLIGRTIREGGHKLEEIPRSIEKLIDSGAWKRYRIYTGEIVEHKHFSELITGEPPRGWGFQPGKVEALLKDEPLIHAKYGAAMKGQRGGDTRSEIAKTNHYNVMNGKQGNSKSYTLSRLRRDHPKLFERVCNGELSANAAAIEAGFRKVKTPEEQCVAAFRKCADKQAVLSMLQQELSTGTINGKPTTT